ncbi:MAG: FumA C-terminus/TtdB family hydratase beta subunit [Candidatus Omnitrophota bacterium]
MIKITTPLTEAVRTRLKCGEEVLFSGSVYTARDAAHKKLAHLIASKEELPINLQDEVIYYAGPTPCRKDGVFGSCGPTTSSRMDDFSVLLMEKGITGMIGKGRRSPEVISSIKKYKAVYFLTIGGAGAYLAKKIKKVELAAFEDLGPEAIYRLELEDFPLIVGVDSQGNSIYPV